MTTPEQSWWTPVWRGLVVDREAKHVGHMGKALWLYLYLLEHADRQSGRLRRKYGTIACDMGLPVRTIRAWMRRLEVYDYVLITRTGRAMVIDITKWRPVGRHSVPLSGTSRPGRVAGFGPETNGESPRSEQPRDQNDERQLPNKSPLTRVIKREGSVEKVSEPDGKREDNSPARLGLLASDLAAGLGDPENHRQYLAYAAQYPEPMLRQILSEVRAVPAARIKRSRAALFEYLLQQYAVSHASTESEDPRH